MRSVRIPSTSSTWASPIMAKSDKSRCACSRNRCRSGPSTGGMPRVRTASARARTRATISCGSKVGTAVSVRGDVAGHDHGVRRRHGVVRGRYGSTPRFGFSKAGPAHSMFAELGRSKNPVVSHYTGGHAGVRGCAPGVGGGPPSGPGVTRSSREKGTPSAIRGSAQPQAVFDGVHGTLCRVRRRAGRRARVVVPGRRGPVRPHSGVHAHQELHFELGRRPAQRLSRTSRTTGPTAQRQPGRVGQRSSRRVVPPNNRCVSSSSSHDSVADEGQRLGVGVIGAVAVGEPVPAADPPLDPADVRGPHAASRSEGLDDLAKSASDVLRGRSPVRELGKAGHFEVDGRVSRQCEQGGHAGPDVGVSNMQPHLVEDQDELGERPHQCADHGGEACSRHEDRHPPALAPCQGDVVAAGGCQAGRSSPRWRRHGGRQIRDVPTHARGAPRGPAASGRWSPTGVSPTRRGWANRLERAWERPRSDAVLVPPRSAPIRHLPPDAARRR